MIVPVIRRDRSRRAGFAVLVPSLPPTDEGFAQAPFLVETPRQIRAGSRRPSGLVRSTKVVSFIRVTVRLAHTVPVPHCSQYGAQVTRKRVVVGPSHQVPQTGHPGSSCPFKEPR